MIGAEPVEVFLVKKEKTAQGSARCGAGVADERFPNLGSEFYPPVVTVSKGELTVKYIALFNRLNLDIDCVAITFVAGKVGCNTVQVMPGSFR